MNNRRIIIGDVHGQYDTLMKLLDAIALNKEDEVYFLGDLIDRGPKSAEVVNFVKENNYPCILGNHEKMLLDTIVDGAISPEMLQAWLCSGGQATVASYNSNIPQEHIDWFNSLPLYLDLGDIWLVHAGVDPSLPLEKQSEREFCWIREKFHATTKPYFPDKLIITGHTITFTLPGVKPGKLAAGVGWLDIDTGAYHSASGWLTALDPDNKVVYQANGRDGKTRKLSLNQAVTKIDPAQIVPRTVRGKQRVGLSNIWQTS